MQIHISNISDTDTKFKLDTVKNEKVQIHTEIQRI